MIVGMLHQEAGHKNDRPGFFIMKQATRMTVRIPHQEEIHRNDSPE